MTLAEMLGEAWGAERNEKGHRGGNMFFSGKGKTGGRTSLEFVRRAVIESSFLSKGRRGLCFFFGGGGSATRQHEATI